MATPRKKASPKRKLKAKTRPARKRGRPAPARKKSARVTKRPARVAVKRKAPASATVARTFEMLLNTQAPAVRQLAERLRHVVRDALPDAEENIYGGARVGMALYSIGDQSRVVCGIQPAGDECLVYVHNVLADDSTSLVLEGKGKHSFQIRFRSINRDEQAALHALVRLARERLLA